MEYCDGGDLMNRINMQRGVLFDEDQVCFHFKELFSFPLGPSII